MVGLNQSFRSESYDRLMVAQAKHHDASAVLDSRNVSFEAVVATLHEPIATGEALRSARTRLGWSQSRLGEALGLDAARVSLMETGKQPIGSSVDLAMRALVATQVAP